MAFYDDQDENKEQLDPNAPSPVQTSNQSAVISGQGSAGGPVQSTKAAPDKSSNFVGIKQYLDANKSQAEKLGNQTAGVIDQSANDARQKVTELNSVADNTIKPVETLDSNVSQKLSSSPEALSQEERNKVKSTANAKWTGPRSETDLGDAYTNALKASSVANQNIDKSGTEEGRMGLISQVNSKPRNQGINIFDNALLQAGGGREKLAQAAAANQDVKGALDQASQNIRAKIGRSDDPTTPEINEATGAIGQTLAAQNDAYTKLQGALNNWQSSFTPKVEQSRNDLVALNNRLAQDFGGEDPYTLNDETLQMLGLAPDTNVYGLDLNSYFNPASPMDVNEANVASADDYARYLALAEMAGVQDPLLKAEDIGKAGTAPKSTIDTSKLQSDLAAKKELDRILGEQDKRVDDAKKALRAYQNSIGYGDDEMYFLNSRNPVHAARLSALQAEINRLDSERTKWKRENDFDHIDTRLKKAT